MKKLLVLLASSLLLGTSVVLATEDYGCTNSLLPGLTAEGETIAPLEAQRGDVFDFPTSADTWTMTYYPNWWNTGDTVYGTFTTTETVDHAEISFTITSNVLSGGGHVDLEFQIDGTPVGSVTVTEASGFGPITGSFDFAPIAAGPHELRYHETNTVGSGLGSFVMNEATGINSVSFSTLALEQSTWGSIKASI